MGNDISTGVPAMTGTTTKGRARRLWIAAALSLVGFPVFAILHNAFDGLAMHVGGGNAITAVLDFLSIACFVIALLCPAAAGAFASAALITRLFAGGPAWLRWILMGVVPAAAGWLAVRLIWANPISTRVKDASAGFNGSFEVVRSGRPVNWWIYRAPIDKGDADLVIDSSTAAEGSRSVRFQVHTVGTGRWSAGLFQVVDAQEGGAYDVSFWLRNEGSAVRLLITSETPQSREERRPIEATLAAEETGEGAWRRFSYRYTVPAHYANVRFELRVVAPGTLWVDDVRIEPVAGSIGPGA